MACGVQALISIGATGANVGPEALNIAPALIAVTPGNLAVNPVGGNISPVDLSVTAPADPAKPDKPSLGRRRRRLLETTSASQDSSELQDTFVRALIILMIVCRSLYSISCAHCGTQIDNLESCCLDSTLH